MKTLAFIICLMASGLVWGVNDTISDTTYKHSVIVIDEHLVVQDSIFIETTIEKVKKEIKVYESGDVLEKIVSISVISLVLISFINHYVKRKRNG